MRPVRIMVALALMPTLFSPAAVGAQENEVVERLRGPVEGEVEAYAEAGADMIVAHWEAGPHPHRTLQAIRATGKKAGISLIAILGWTLSCDRWVWSRPS